MLPIYVMHDSGLDEFEVNVIKSGLAELKETLPERQIYNYGAETWCEGAYSSADWYISKGKSVMRPDHPAQLDARSVLLLTMREPWQIAEKHIDIIFTSQDLTTKYEDGYLNFCFGLTMGRYTIQSVARFRDLPLRDRCLVIKSLMWHELGHVLGAAGNLLRDNTVDKLGSHCINYGCVMQQGMTVQEMVQNARQAERRGRIYCPDCMADIRKSPI